MVRVRERSGARDVWRAALVGGVVVAVALASCGSSGSTANSVRPTTTSSPFAVGSVPAGYRLVVAGTGNQDQLWGSDSFGTDEPFTVLSTDGKASGPGVAVVSATGYQGYEGKLAQASEGCDGRTVHGTVDGHESYFTPAGTCGRRAHGADLVVDRGSDVAIRVTKARATQAELERIERRATPPTNHLLAPAVADPPDGLRVVGHVDADVVMAANGATVIGAAADAVPGSSRSHSVGWRSGARTLAVTTMPGTAADVAAFAAYPVAETVPSPGTARAVTVDGRPGLLYSERELTRADLASGSSGTGPAVPRLLLTTTSWGDLLAVATAAQCCGVAKVAPPTVQDLVATAASVTRATDAQWKALQDRAFGEPGLEADAGRSEVARGTTDGVTWLLQTGVPDAEAGPENEPIDPCLKLSTRQRACARGATASGPAPGGGGTTWTFPSPDAGSPALHGLPPFAIVASNEPGDALWVTTSTGTQRGELHPIPGSTYRAGIVFLHGTLRSADVH